MSVAVLANEQSAIEQTLDPAAFGLVGVGDLLRRNVAKLLAAEVLAMRAREVGASGDVQVGGGADAIHIARVPDGAASLRTEANAALAPYRRREPILGARGAMSSALPTGVPLSDWSVQDRLYGRTEQGRLERDGERGSR